MKGEKMMNAKARTIMTAAFMLILGFFFIDQPTSAQSGRGFFRPVGDSSQTTTALQTSGACKNLKGIRIDTFDPAAGTAFGAITGGGLLNGTTADVTNFDAGFVFTPDPNIVTYLSDTTITTNRGELKTRLVTTFNVVTGVFTQWGNIDPNTSTGRFAGATGVIYFPGISIGNPSIGPYKSEVVGEICLDRDR
jgi:hypothetical protein